MNSSRVLRKGRTYVIEASTTLIPKLYNPYQKKITEQHGMSIDTKSYIKYSQIKFSNV